MSPRTKSMRKECTAATQGIISRRNANTCMARGGMNANKLKLIAIAAMTMDHLTWLLFPGYTRAALPLLMHLLGRITCPIMCFFIAEGYYHTRSVKKYALRLLMLAIISHFAYLLASNDYADWRSFIPFYYGSVLNQTGVIWSLLGGLLMLCINDSKRLNAVTKALCVLLICALTFSADWSCIAALCILSIGSNRGRPKRQIAWCMFYVTLYALVYALALDTVYGALQLGAVLAIPLLALYNGQRGNPTLSSAMKWLFYIYYPLHLAIIGLIRLLWLK